MVALRQQRLLIVVALEVAAGRTLNTLAVKSLAQARWCGWDSGAGTVAALAVALRPCKGRKHVQFRSEVKRNLQHRQEHGRGQHLCHVQHESKRT